MPRIAEIQQTADPLAMADPYAGDPWSWTREYVKRIPSHPLYCVGSLGNVWSSRITPENPLGKWRLLTREITPKGYPCVRVPKPSSDGKHRSHRFRIHSLVAAVFLGPRPEGLECLHRDGNKLNASLDNLRYGTPAENMADQYRLGERVRGERVGGAKLTEQVVKDMFVLHYAGFTIAEIAAHFAANQRTVRNAINGDTWTHLGLANGKSRRLASA